MASRYTGGTGSFATQVCDMMEKRGHQTQLLHAPIIPVKNMSQPSFAVSSAIRAALDRTNHDIVHAFGIPAAPAMRLARAKKRVLTVGGVYSDQFGIIHPGLAHSIVESLEPRALSWADVLTTDSDNVRKAYKEKRDLDFEVLLGPLDTSRFEKIAPKSQDGPLVVYVGRDSVEKGIQVLRKAEPQIHARVEYCTSVPWEEAMQTLASADVFVQPSLAESIPNATKEAQFLKIPTVGSNVGGIPEIIEHEKTGLLVPPDDADALAAAVNRLLDDKTLATRITDEAYKSVITKFSSESLADVYENFYKNLLS